MPHVANVTVNSSQVTSDHTDFVVYVDLSDLPTTEFWGAVSNGGGDIRCYKSDGTTELAREVVSCDTATDTGELHVRYDGTLSSSVDTEIQIWTDEGTEPAVTATYGRNAVWGDYELVLHGDDYTDSTGKSTLSATGTVGSASGVIGSALDTQGSSASNYLRTASSGIGALTTSTPITLQGWIFRESDPAITGFDEVLVEAHDGVDGAILALDVDNVPTLYTSGGNTGGRSGGSELGEQTWYSLASAWDQAAAEVSVYIDGGLDGSVVGSYGDTSSYSSGSTVTVSQAFTNTESGIDGQIDEVRIRYAALSADWIADEYTNQNTPATFYTVSAVSGTPVTVTLSNASETDTALPTSISPIIELDFGFAAETDTAEAITISANVNVALGVASETDTALPTTIAPTQLVTFSAATEADSALPVTVIVDVTVPIGVASEADTALPMEFLTTIFLSLGVADEVDNALRVAINAGGSFSRGALNDAMIQYFNQRGYNGALSGQMIEWLQANGAVSANLPDAWMEMLNAKITAPVESWNDAWFYLLGVNGFTQGTLPDRQLAFFLSNANLLGE